MNLLHISNLDLMTYLYIGGLFTLLVLCLYALIQSKANRIYTFTIIPFALVMALFTWQAITAFRGQPIIGLPYDKEITILYVYDHKPWIYTVLADPELGPIFYKIPWTKDNQKKMKALQKQVGTAEAEGKFKKALLNDVESFEFADLDSEGHIIPKEQPSVQYMTKADIINRGGGI